MTEKELLVNEALEQICEQTGKGLSLKAEQKDAIHSLLLGRIVLVVLPTGFGKSLIFQLFATAKTI